VTVREQRIDEVAADEAGPADQRDAHGFDPPEAAPPEIRVASLMRHSCMRRAEGV
jgi:hypothetical protein